MKSTPVKKNTIQELIEFSKAFSTHTDQLIAAIDNAEKIHSEIRVSISKIPITIKDASTVTQDLMNIILSRDIQTLLSNMQLMKKTLKDIVDILIKNGSTALQLEYCITGSNKQDLVAFVATKERIASNLSTLRHLESTLL